MEETTEVEITNPTNSAEEVFDTWEYIGDEDCPDWLTSTLVKKYCEI